MSDLLPLLVSGSRIDPNQPDRVLSRSEEQQRLMDRLSRLPPRYGLFADRIAGTAHVIRTLDLPYEEARRRAAQMPASQRERFALGKAAMPLSQLLAQPARLSVEATSPTSRPARSSSRGRKPALVLP